MAKNQQVKAKSAKVLKGAKSSSSTTKPATTKAAKSSKKGVAARIKDSLPNAPSMPTMPSMPHIEMPQGVRDVGAYLSTALNTDAGRFIMAEILIQVAKALTVKLAHTDTAQHAVSSVREAGGQAGDAVLKAGTKALADAGSAINAGTDLASAARGVAREVAQAAVGAVGGAVVQAAQNMLPGRKGKTEKAEAPPPAPMTIPASRPRGTPKPPQLGRPGPRR